MISLRFLGRTAVERDGEPVSGAAMRRHPLAVLGLLVRAPGRRMSREKLIGSLWPDRLAARGRQRLRETLRILRRALGSDCLASVGDDVVLDPTHVESDVWAFEEARSRSDHHRAVDVYAGPFLDGFHLRRGPIEFDEWMEGERAELEAAYRRALEALAVAAEEEGDPVGAVAWWRRLVAATPEDARVVARLMRMLVASGNRAGALEQARLHAAFLEEEFGTDPHPQVQAYAEEIRLEPPEVGPEVFDPLAPGPPTARRPAPAGTEGAGAGAVPRSTDRSGGTRRGAAGRRWSGAIGAAALLTLAVVWTRGGSPAPPPAGGSSGASRVLVTRFSDHGGHPDLASLGTIAADWIGQELGRTGLVQVVPWSAAARSVSPAEREADVTDASAAALARDLGAGLVVTGSYEAASDLLLFRARILRADGELVRVIEVSGAPAKAPLEAVEGLRRRIAGVLATVVDPRLAEWSSVASQPPSYVAYRRFADGLEAHLDQRDAEADRLFLAAAAEDPAFTAPLIWAIRARLHVDNHGRADSLIAVLEPRRAELAPWDRAMFDYYRALVRGTWEEAYVAAGHVAAWVPTSEWLLEWARAAVHSGRPEEGLRIHERIDPDRGWIAGWPHHWRLRAQTRHWLGQYHEELEEMDLWRDRLPADVPTVELRALAGLGRLDRHRERMEGELARLDSRRGRVTFLEAAASELAAHGHVEQARGLVVRALEILDSTAPDGGGDGWRGDLARIGFLSGLGRWEEAREALRAARAHGELPDPVLLREDGLISAGSGRAEEARAHCARLRPSPTRGDRGWSAFECARIEAVLGDRDEAVRWLHTALREGGGRYFWLHAAPELAPLRGYPPFEAFLRKPPGSSPGIP